MAIDAAPCLGDAGFDAVDLIFWQADDRATIESRISSLARTAGLDEEQLLGWCVAFAAMNALELATKRGSSHERIEALRKLASQTPAG